MIKLLPIEENGVVVGYIFECPGCGENHALYVRPHRAANGESWDFNGDVEKPSFYPSILTRIQRSDGKFRVCHLYVKDGKIQFLRDCTHSLALNWSRFQSRISEFLLWGQRPQILDRQASIMLYVTAISFTALRGLPS